MSFYLFLFVMYVYLSLYLSCGINFLKVSLDNYLFTLSVYTSSYISIFFIEPVYSFLKLISWMHRSHFVIAFLKLISYYLLDY